MNYEPERGHVVSGPQKHSIVPVVSMAISAACLGIMLVLLFTVHGPMGPRGLQGPQGATGATGPQGIPGVVPQLGYVCQMNFPDGSYNGPLVTFYFACDKNKGAVENP